MRSIFNFFVLITACALAVTGILACGQAQVESFEGDAYGDGIRNASYIEQSALIASLKTQDTVQATLLARVSEVCQAKGCWMTLHDGTEDGDIVMVRFKDYGFFVPKDIAGRRVLVEGKAYKSVTQVDELRHYAEDAGRSEEEIMSITEPEDTYSFLATGVLVLRD